MNYERDDKDSSKRIEFRPPAEFKSPENVEPGKDWDMVCSFRTKPDGTICMTKLGDVDLPGYGTKEDHDDEPKHKPGYGEYVDKLGLSDGMPANSGPTPQS